MATQAKTVTESGAGPQRQSTVVWDALPNGDDGAPVTYPAKKLSVQVSGVFGAGGNLILEGSNDGVTYATLDDLEDAALATIAAAGLYQIRDMAKFVRPRVSAGDGTTALVCTLVAA